jgi:hypothetical protein
MPSAAVGSSLRPEVPYTVARRYRAGTNVLETTFTTDRGIVLVTDALTLPTDALGPLRELSRRIEGVAGSVPMAWSVEPRFGYAVGARACRSRPPAATRWPSAPSTQAPEVAGGAIRGRFEARAGERALLALCAAHSEPLVLPAAS